MRPFIQLNLTTLIVLVLSCGTQEPQTADSNDTSLNINIKICPVDPACMKRTASQTSCYVKDPPNCVPPQSDKKRPCNENPFCWEELEGYVSRDYTCTDMEVVGNLREQATNFRALSRSDYTRADGGVWWHAEGDGRDLLCRLDEECVAQGNAERACVGEKGCCLAMRKQP